MPSIKQAPGRQARFCHYVILACNVRKVHASYYTKFTNNYHLNLKPIAGADTVGAGGHSHPLTDSGRGVAPPPEF